MDNARGPVYTRRRELIGVITIITSAPRLLSKRYPLFSFDMQQPSTYAATC